ncbi:glutamate receptor ionotropic, kainate 5-like [Centruroides sculpturatus]|uniref:glutamate receptor ionotropic, kainate 5-like n=1 Tax=Centruroides sculpturatus TaxID=218467 RepID=UPI000C6E6928|nr:glutamate receptor ionotropic, kainate 5-like [Centruroides sculpturatus]
MNTLQLIIISATFIVTLDGTDNTSNGNLWKIAGVQIDRIMKFDPKEERIIEGIHFNLFKILQEELKFTYQMVKPIPEILTGRLKNGTWIGMYGQLVNNKAEFAYFPTFIRKDLYEILHYSSLVAYNSILFVVRAPEENPNWYSFGKPFAPEEETSVN